MGGNGEQEEAEDGKRDNKDVGAYLVGGEDECPNTKRTPFEEQEQEHRKTDRNDVHILTMSRDNDA